MLLITTSWNWVWKRLSWQVANKPIICVTFPHPAAALCRYSEEKRKLWVHKVFRAREEEGEFHTLFGRLKDDWQKFYKYLRMSVSKFENLKQLLHTVIEKKNTRWRRSIRTEERLAFNCKVT
jgi:hypothetical protein